MADTYTVKAGDTLSKIASDHHIGSTPMEGAKQLAAINGIKNINLIYVGQVLKLSGSGGGGSSTASSNKATITQFGEQSDSYGTIFAVWSWSKSNTENYQVRWYYATGDGHWFVGNDGTTEFKESTYSFPSNAKQIKFKVKPISKKKTVNNKETAYWEADWSDEKIFKSQQLTPSTPSVPSIEIDKFKLTAEVENIDVNASQDQIEFQVVKKGTSKAYKTGKAKIVNRRASYSCTVAAGAEYAVRCRAYRSSDKTYSDDWSDYSSYVATIPNPPGKIIYIQALSSSAVQIQWEKVSGFKSGEDSCTIEYTTNEIYFDSSPSNVSSVTVPSPDYAQISGLTPGNEYFFRVKVTKNEVGDSGWSEIKSIVLGEKPGPPTTWSSTTTAIVGEPVTLYWVHNSKDGSAIQYSELKLTVDGQELPSLDIRSWYKVEYNSSTNLYTSTDEQLDFDPDGEALGVTTVTYEDVYSCIHNGVTVYYCQKNGRTDGENSVTKRYSLDTAGFSEGATIKWKVRTAGITHVYGDWSVERIINIYAAPTVEISLEYQNGDIIDIDNPLTQFPFYLHALPGQSSSLPIGYYVTVISNDSYETVDNVGNEKIVSAGEQIYSRYIDMRYDSLHLEFSPSTIDLENNISYTLTCTVSMDSGLTGDSEQEFSVEWTDESYTPNAEITYDNDTYVTYIHPYCQNVIVELYKVSFSGGIYTKTDDTLESVWGEPKDGAITETGEQVYEGVDNEGNSIFYCEVTKSELLENVSLSVYRREYDGSFTEIASGLDNESNTFVTDPHPALDYARYRIVSIKNDTGAVSYYDVPGVPIQEKAVIIQWDETWTDFDTVEGAELEQQPWTGSLLRLPYNIDVSDKNTTDVSLVEYIGRSHPVSYYGTQLGVTSTWGVSIDKSDKDTLYALRRLAIWPGDVYVREPSGSGYWANIKVSFSQTHREVVIPVSLDITRVEGGI